MSFAEGWVQHNQSLFNYLCVFCRGGFDSISKLSMKQQVNAWTAAGQRQGCKCMSVMSNRMHSNGSLPWKPLQTWRRIIWKPDEALLIHIHTQAHTHIFFIILYILLVCWIPEYKWVLLLGKFYVIDSRVHSLQVASRELLPLVLEYKWVWETLKLVLGHNFQWLWENIYI